MFVGFSKQHSSPVSGEGACGTINYASVMGMLLYLSGESGPELSFAIHQCAHYTFAPTKYNKQRQQRPNLTPSHPHHLDYYLVADFAGMWKHKDSNDPHCVNSHTGYAITLTHCPIIWASKMQTVIALSAMGSK